LLLLLFFPYQHRLIILQEKGGVPLYIHLV
jgi:hypothetical protein